MLSARGLRSIARQDIPWCFTPGTDNRYDPEHNPSGVVSLAMAENNLMHKELHEYVQNNVSIPELAYTYRYSTLGGPRFPMAMAAHINEHFNCYRPVKPEDIITASALTSIHELVGYCLGDSGDGILVGPPIYGRFELDFGNTSELEMVYADTSNVDPFSPAVVKRYQEALDKAADGGVKIKALLIVNPSNPMGRSYPRETLRLLMAFCQKNRIHLVSDEIYGLSTYQMGRPSDMDFMSVLAIDSQELIDDDLLHVFYGMSKDFAAAGIRIGSLITRSTSLRKAVAGNMRFHNPSGPSIAIATAILEDRAFVSRFLRLSRERLRDARAFTEKKLSDAGVSYAEGNAGFFVFVDLSPWLEIPDPVNHGSGSNSEFDLAQKLLNAGVGLHPCEEHAIKKGQFRIVFSQQRSILEEGLRRLVITQPLSEH
ncbi:1-aminocyclopropane-1-carboxylate synthase [Xylariaceae sp. FL0255]|nr:1-aminocyclopropane-1-carboxylate synthase [Xylariaceae sp. FL0255]